MQKAWLLSRLNLWASWAAAALMPAFLLGRFWAEVCLLLTLVLFLVFGIFSKKKHFQPPTGPCVFLFLFWATAFVSSLLSPLLTWGAVLQNFLWVRFPLFLWVYSGWLGHEKRAVNLFLYGATLACVCLVLDSFWQYTTGFSILGYPLYDGRLTSFLKRPFVGLFLAWFLFPLLGVWGGKISWRSSKTFVLAALFWLSLLLILLTGDRTAMVLVMVGALFMAGNLLWFYPEHKALLLLFLLLALISVAICIGVSTYLQMRLSLLWMQIKTFSCSSYGNLFQTAWYVFKKSPILGWGPGSFRILSHQMFLNGQSSFSGLHPHNFYLECLCETGIVGFVFFTFAVGQLWRSVHSLPNYFRRSSFLASLVVIFFPVAAHVSLFSNTTLLMLMGVMIIFETKDNF